jgi:hypothetical protein
VKKCNRLLLSKLKILISVQYVPKNCQRFLYVFEKDLKIAQILISSAVCISFIILKIVSLLNALELTGWFDL